MSVSRHLIKETSGKVVGGVEVCVCVWGGGGGGGGIEGGNGRAWWAGDRWGGGGGGSVKRFWGVEGDGDTSFFHSRLWHH